MQPRLRYKQLWLHTCQDDAFWLQCIPSVIAGNSRCRAQRPPAATQLSACGTSSVSHTRLGRRRRSPLLSRSPRGRRDSRSASPAPAGERNGDAASPRRADDHEISPRWILKTELGSGYLSKSAEEVCGGCGRACLRALAAGLTALGRGQMPV